jgi:hypothetical protein
MREIPSCNFASALMIGVLIFSGIAIAGDEDSKKIDAPTAPPTHDKVAAEHAVPAHSGKVPKGPKTLGPVLYECTAGQCTCSTPADCGVMGGDHVCADGTFKTDTKTAGGSCMLKKAS